MKTPVYFRFPALLSTILLGVTALTAQVAPQAPNQPERAEAPPVPPAESAPENNQEPGTPEVSDTPASLQASESDKSPAEENDEAGLRRLDQADEAGTEEAVVEQEAERAAAEEEEARAVERQPHHRHHHGANERVMFWENATLAADETAGAVVSIFGSSTSAGRVHDAVVSVLGSSTSTGTVGNAVVSVLGNSRASGGRVSGGVVSVLGNTYVDTEVGGEVVAVLGNIELGPNAVVHGELVCVGGVVKRDPGAVVHGETTNVAFALNLGGFEWLHAWISRCLMFGRPLAFGDNLMWAWWIALGFLGFYIVIALLFPRGVEKCAQTLETHPGYSLLTAILVTIGTPLAAVVLAITIVGAPVLFFALFVAGVFGKIVMLAWIGRRLTKLFGNMASPALAVLVGGVIVLLLYTVPVIGLLLFKLLGWLGLGAVVYTIILNAKRPRVATTAAVAGGASTLGGTSVVTPTSPSAPLAVVVPPAAASSTESAVPPAASVPPAPTVPPVMPVPPMPVIVSAATLPRAGFWIRIAASAIDVLIVALTGNLIPDQWQPNLLGIFAVYCGVLWGLKGTTVGGIICGLKIVRLDERKVDWPTAIVRVLGGFLSLAAAGIGFIWVAFDEQRQSWHDKIAGTTIVHVPKGVSLV